MFQWKTGLSERQRICQNVQNLWSLRKNDVPFDRGLGLNADIIDKPISKTNSSIISDMVDIVYEREPRADITVNGILNNEKSMEEIIIEVVMN